MADPVQTLEEVLAKGCGAVKFFGKINFPFAQKERAEEVFLSALKEVASRNGEQAKKASILLDTFDGHINSAPVQRFWEEVRLQNEKDATRRTQLLFAEKKKQRAFCIGSDVAEEHIISSHRLLLESKARKIPFDVSFDEYVDLGLERKRKQSVDDIPSDEEDENVDDHQAGTKSLITNALEGSTRKKERISDVSPEIYQPENEESSDSSYLPSSQSSDSVDSVEQPRERIEWIIGLGSEVSILPEGSKHWVIDDVDVSEMLMEFRQHCIEKAHSDDLENVTQVLALNHVFLFEDGKENNLREMFDGELWMAVVNDIEKQSVSYRLSNDDILRCHAMSEAASHTFEDCKSLLRKWQQQEADGDVLTEFFESILQQESWWNQEDQNEDAFVHEILGPVLKPFFASNKLLKRNWSTDTLDASSHRKKKFDPSLQGRKPDFSVFTSVKSKKEFLFVAEIKSPKHRGRSDLLDDKAKLGNEMKDSLDMMIDDGIENDDVIICGLLVQGFRCSVYTIDLKYDGVYRMALLGQFFLPRDNHEFWGLANAIQILMKAKIIVTHTCEICVKGLRTSKFKSKVVSKEQDLVAVGGENELLKTPQRKLMVRGSFFTPYLAIRCSKYELRNVPLR